LNRTLHKIFFSFLIRDVRQKLIDAGRGNPRLMEALNTLVGVKKEVAETLLTKVKGKQEEFVQKLVLMTMIQKIINVLL
jgi:hypothetical protein